MASSSARAPLRRVLREPLLHFAVLGALVFGLSRWLGADEDDGTTVVIDAAIRERIATETERTLGRPPTEAERAEALERWIDRELLYREGLALGLDRGDPLVRDRVIQKMEFVSTNLELPPLPDDDTLRAFMAEYAERYAEPPRYDFVMVTVPQRSEQDEATVQVVLQQLRDGADPKAVEGRFASGRRFSAANAAGTYGPAIAAALVDASPGQWTRVSIPGGISLLRVDAVEPGATPPFERIRNRVVLDWKASRRGAALRERIDALRRRYRIEQVP